MKKESKINRYAVYTEIVFLNRTDVYSTSKNEAIEQIRDITSNTSLLLERLDKCERYYRIKDVELKEKNVDTGPSVIFIYEDEKLD